MRRILFVDDEKLMLEVIEARFSDQSSKWEMDFATSGEEALRRMAEKEYEVVIADLRMPQMDGFELLSRVAQQHPGTTRIMLSGQVDHDQTRRLADAAHYFLPKPCSLDELEASLQQALEKRDASDCNSEKQRPQSSSHGSSQAV